MGEPGNEMKQQTNERMKITLENDADIPDKLPGEFTIVRVWVSEYNTDRMQNTQYVFCCGETSISTLSVEDIKTAEEGESKGHVSMELILNRKRGTKANDTYLSFGPQEETLRNCFEKHDAVYIENYNKDLEYMGRKPNYTIIFYSLDVPGMTAALQKLIKVEKQKWTLAGPRINMGNANDFYGKKIVKGVQFCWWSLCQCAAALAKLPFERIMVSTEGNDTLMDPTVELTPDKNGEITMSCVSSVFYILHKGKFTNLLPRKDQRRIVAGEFSAASGQSVKNILQVNLEKVLRNSGYIFHLGISSVVINPDAFLCIIKYAKKQEIKTEKVDSKYKILFKNNNITLKMPPEDRTANENSKSTNGYKHTVELPQWIPKTIS